jgi:hypothetical protein
MTTLESLTAKLEKLEAMAANAEQYGTRFQVLVAKALLNQVREQLAALQAKEAQS